MWRLIRFLFTGDGHLHKWKFTHVDYFSGIDGEKIHNISYVKVCEVCGDHQFGELDNCRAKSAEDLNL